jgi:ribosome-associated protein
VRRLAAFLADKQQRELDDRELTSRSDLRKERKEAENAFADLALALCGCSDKQFKRLDLPEALRHVVLEARSIESPPARDRALRLVRRELRNGGDEVARRQLEALNKPKGTIATKILDVWLERFVNQGELALNEFIEKHPGADRQQLRGLLRNAQKPNNASQKRALKALSNQIEILLRGEPSE